ncbi:MAG: phosphoglucomutase/phosphomannomutase family protein [Candidatus Omnitrophica bacterium]|nr:phosphoglucomutase/phosphomannomutase family protein [Candidatus Omnitrophota bacterium]MDD5487458.1 phosphoglucomutase/phosphomannomutase family protein [Candidatus Omnitrophota bacterium]
MSNIKFGTDGWRAIISKDFTFDNVEIVAQAIADFIKAQKKPIYRKRKIVVGYDTRFLSKEYAETVACVVAANGIKVVLSDKPSPTPAVCVYIREKKLTGGVMITASHNPFSYNGIKYKGYFAGSAGSDIIDDIEKRLYKSKVKKVDMDKAVSDKKVMIEDIVSVQLKVVKKYADMKKLKKAKLRVLIDSMNGTGGNYIRTILKDTSIKTDYIYDEVNPGFNGRPPEPNEKHLKELVAGIKKGKYDLGIATDGDSDRLAVVDEKGNVLSGHKLMAVLLLHLFRNRKKKGGVIQTICGTGQIENMCRKFGLKCYETPVGFKYICEMMLKKDILIGGEETGGVTFKGYVPERDGFLSALLVMELIVSAKKPLSRIVADMNREFGDYVYEREDMVFDSSKRKKLMKGLKDKPLKDVLGRPVVDIKDYDGTKFICDDGSWLLVRLSGTEPKLRIYSETRTRGMSLKYIGAGKKYALKLMS